jgi:hypothetical protein
LHRSRPLPLFLPTPFHVYTPSLIGCILPYNHYHPQPYLNHFPMSLLTLFPLRHPFSTSTHTYYMDSSFTPPPLPPNDKGIGNIVGSRIYNGTANVVIVAKLPSFLTYLELNCTHSSSPFNIPNTPPSLRSI